MSLCEHNRSDMRYIRAASEQKKRKEARLISIETRFSNLEKEVKLLRKNTRHNSNKGA